MHESAAVVSASCSTSEALALPSWPSLGHWVLKTRIKEIYVVERYRKTTTQSLFGFIFRYSM